MAEKRRSHFLVLRLPSSSSFFLFRFIIISLSFPLSRAFKKLGRRRRRGRGEVERKGEEKDITGLGEEWRCQRHLPLEKSPPVCGRPLLMQERCQRGCRWLGCSELWAGLMWCLSAMKRRLHLLRHSAGVGGYLCM